MAAPSGCSLPRSTAAARRSKSRFILSRPGQNADHARPAFSQRAGLVQDDGVHFFQRLKGLRILDKDAFRARRGRRRP